MVQQYYLGPNSSIKKIDDVMASLPQPKGKKKKKKEAEDGAPAGESPEPAEGKKKKKKKKKVEEGPLFPPMQYGPELTPEQALSTANSWK